MTTEIPDPPKSTKSWVLLAILKYLGAYLLGILTCIIFTPVEINLAGKALWPLFPVLAPIGFFLYYFYLSPQYVFGTGTIYWLVGSIALIPIGLEVVAYIRRSPWLRSWRPLWLGFPIGFVGTLGVYYTAAASI